MSSKTKTANPVVTLRILFGHPKNSHTLDDVRDVRRRIGTWPWPQYTPIGPALGQPPFKGYVNVSGAPVGWRNEEQRRTLENISETDRLWQAEPFAVRGFVGGQTRLWIPAYVETPPDGDGILVYDYDEDYPKEVLQLMNPVLDAFEAFRFPIIAPNP